MTGAIPSCWQALVNITSAGRAREDEVLYRVYNITCNHDPNSISRMTLRPLGENFVPGSVVVVKQIEFSERRWIMPTPGLQRPRPFLIRIANEEAP